MRFSRRRGYSRFRRRGSVGRRRYGGRRMRIGWRI